jgi:SulP family sulfate permease
VSGAFADLGVLIPLEVALIAVNGLNPTSTLLGVGIAYLASGWYFRIPMPVQPLKAFAAIAIAQALSPSVMAAGALLMSLILTLLAVTRAITYLDRAVPLPVVRGVQLGLGIVLIRSALGMVLGDTFLVGGDEQRYVEVLDWQAPAGLLLGVGSIAVLLLFLWRTLLPATATVIAVGVLVGLFMDGREVHLALGPTAVGLALPRLADFPTALVVLVIPQLPLTLTNSVIATVETAHTYYGQAAVRVTPIRTSLSVAACNLWAGLASGLPMCHGSGGLTAHYRLGARTPGATAITGTVLIAVALLFGQSALEVRGLVPSAVLGALLFYVGVQHLLLGLKIKARRHLAVVVLVGTVAATPFGSLAIGAGAGLAAYWVVRWAATLQENRRRRSIPRSARA